MSSTELHAARSVPVPVSDKEQAEFEQVVKDLGLDPGNRWIGGYVDYEWVHLRPLLRAYDVDVYGQRVLEFGCNVGASAVVFAFLGARVRAVDVDASTLTIARANARRYGCEIAFAHMPDTRRLPFHDCTFDLVACNSVLEYVEPDQLAAVQREIDRVLCPGGMILVTGTSSRLWPREVHSGRWFLNYLPQRWVHRLPLAGHAVASIWPWTVRNGFGPGYRNLDAEDGGRAFIAARAAMEPPEDTWVKRLLARLAGGAGVGPGLLMNSIFCLLRKDVAS